MTITYQVNKKQRTRTKMLLAYVGLKKMQFGRQLAFELVVLSFCYFPSEQALELGFRRASCWVSRWFRVARARSYDPTASPLVFRGFAARLSASPLACRSSPNRKACKQASCCTRCWRDPTRLKQVSTVAFWFSVWAPYHVVVLNVLRSIRSSWLYLYKIPQAQC